MTGVRDPDEDDSGRRSGFDYSVNAQSGEGLIQKKAAEGIASLKLQAAQNENINNQNKANGNVLGNNVGNDNSVTNINNNQTKVQTPIIAGNNNDSVNSVTNGNRAFM